MFHVVFVIAVWRAFGKAGAAFKPTAPFIHFIRLMSV